MQVNLSQSMPDYLNSPLCWEQANADELEMLNDLQGNILKGHGRNHTQNLFFTLDPQHTDQGRGFLRVLADYIKSAHQQLIDARDYRNSKQDAGVFISVFLSAAGYRALGITGDKIPSDTAFQGGLKQSQSTLNDPASDKWDSTFQHEIHGMILIGGSDQTQVGNAVTKIQQQKPPSVKIIGIEQGLAMRNENGDGIEHFGYVDGRSQPLLLQEDIEKEKNSGGIDKWNPSFPLSQVLVPCPGGASSKNSYGSYFVFRKLEQNVKGFKEKEEKISEDLQKIADQLNPPIKNNPELAGAMIVGRFEDGTPVVEHKDDGIKPVPNNFNFSDDTEGLKCPFHAHIRKTNPRGESGRAEERSHIMARRGITYGMRDAELDEKGNIKELKDKPVGGVGLLFMAYQRDIANQFEFTQSLWANNPDFVNADTGIDPVIGQHNSESFPPLQQSVAWDNARKEPIDFHGFVTLKGGEYFFAPCISFFKHL
jgi:Dyp-type peroxidase family